MKPEIPIPRIKAPALQPGDTVGIVAPASNIQHDLLDAVLDDAQVLEGLTEQSTHQREALRVGRKPDAEVHVHGDHPSSEPGDLRSVRRTT